MKKRMTKPMNESIDSLDRVVKGDVEANAHLDTTEAVAYDESNKADKRVEEIKNELDKKADGINGDDTESPKVKTNNTYTKTYTLDESLEDFRLEAMSLDDFDDKDDDYDYLLDFDMFDFISKLCQYDGSRNATANPLKDKKKKYNRFGTDSAEDSSHITTDMNGNIVLGHNEGDYFADIMEILDKYQIDYRGPVATPNEDFKFHLYIDVPMLAPNYPMLVGDYFEDIGMSLNDVMYDDKWGDKYHKAIDKINKSNEKELDKRQRNRRADAPKNDSRVKTLFDKAVTYAYQRGDISVEDHLTQLYATLDGEGLRYSKTAVKKNFLAAVEDDFDDEE